VPLVTKAVLALTGFDRGTFSVLTPLEKIKLFLFILFVVVMGATPVMEQAVNAATGLLIVLLSGGSSILMETSGMQLALGVAKINALQSELQKTKALEKDLDVQIAQTTQHLARAKIIIDGNQPSPNTATNKAEKTAEEKTADALQKKLDSLNGKKADAEAKIKQLESKLYLHALSSVAERVSTGGAHRAIEKAHRASWHAQLWSLDSQRVGREERSTLATICGCGIPNPFGFRQPATAGRVAGGAAAVAEELTTNEVQAFVAKLRRDKTS
jgi:hypothetical protein